MFYKRPFPLSPHMLLSRRKMSTYNFLNQTFLASINSVQPEVLIRNTVKYAERHLVIKQDKYELTKPCYLVGFGKAVYKMALEMQSILGDSLQRAIVVVPKGTLFEKDQRIFNNKIEFIEGAEYNLPDIAAMEGAKKIKNLVESLKEDDVLTVLISGGGSALLPLPKANIKLEEKLALIKNLSRSGADILELNCVRKKLSILKGGGLAQIAYPSKVITLVLSDVIGDPLDFIASGPTVINNDPPLRAQEIIKKYNLYDDLPSSIKHIVDKPDEIKNNVANFDHVSNYIIGNNKVAAESAKKFVQKHDIQSVIISTEVEGNVTDIADIYIELAKTIVDIQKNKNEKQNLLNTLKQFPWKTENGVVQEILNLNFSKDICLILAGEPTVVVRGSGLGGRNQHLALLFSILLEKLENIQCDKIFLLSAGTDGGDGPTIAAGAIGGKGITKDAEKYLENCDSHNFFKNFKNGERLLCTGHTGTNVMDIHLLLIKGC